MTGKTPDSNAAIKADFSRKTGKINRNLHSSNYMPAISVQSVTDFNEEYKALGFTMARTHDQALFNAGQRVCDNFHIFPLEHLDANDPRNYFFKPTDCLLENLYSCGTKAFFRMGTSIEHSLSNRHFNTEPPKDFRHWAEVMEHVIMHYNEGWNNGMNLGIEYWEIWNEPDLGCRCWNGTQEQFCGFFATVLKHLKSRFPGIKVGGPAMCGLNHEWFDAVLSRCEREGIAPDFLSWHCYTSNVDAITQTAGEMRKIADNHGMHNAELCLNEWHYLKTWEGIHENVTEESYIKALCGDDGLFGIDSAAFNAACIAAWHDTELDSAMYYGAGCHNSDGTFGLHTLSKGLNKNYYSMKFIGDFMRACEHRVSASSAQSTVKVLAGTDKNGNNPAMLISDYTGSGTEIHVEVSGLGHGAGEWSVRRLDSKSDDETIAPETHGSTLVLRKRGPGSAVFLCTGRP